MTMIMPNEQLPDYGMVDRKETPMRKAIRAHFVKINSKKSLFHKLTNKFLNFFKKYFLCH